MKDYNPIKWDLFRALLMLGAGLVIALLTLGCIYAAYLVQIGA